MPLALVTGSGGRLGAVIARHLAKNGFKVIAHVNKSRPAGKKLVREIIEDGGQAVLTFCDFGGKPSTVTGFFQDIVGEHGVPDLIVNNASVFQYDFPGKGSVRLLDESIAVHVRAPFLLLEIAFRKATGRRPVTVINILDQKVVNPNPDYYSYTVGKVGLHAITTAWQMNPSNRLRVFGILPGLLFPSGKQTQGDFEKVRNDTILGRNPSPQEIANAVLFVAENKSLPGQNLVIDGGESLVRRKRDIAYE
jgi:NAD(P)-dependent dehydrogenase (short-subunit alcohol dehydrogenase family)